MEFGIAHLNIVFGVTAIPRGEAIFHIVVHAERLSIIDCLADVIISYMLQRVQHFLSVLADDLRILQFSCRMRPNRLVTGRIIFVLAGVTHRFHPGVMIAGAFDRYLHRWSLDRLCLFLLTLLAQ